MKIPELTVTILPKDLRVIERLPNAITYRLTNCEIDNAALLKMIKDEANEAYGDGRSEGYSSGYNDGKKDAFKKGQG